MEAKIVHPLLLILGCLALALMAQKGVTAEGNDTDIVVVVSRLNPMASLSQNQVEDIFLGRTQQFPDGQPAVPVDQAQGSQLRERFNTEVLGRSSAQVRTHWSRILFTGRGRPPLSVGSNEEVLEVITQEPLSIGYIERRFVNDAVTVVFE